MVGGSSTQTRLIQQAFHGGRVTSHVKRGKQQEASKFELYSDHREPVSKILSHRLLAMLRGQDEGLLKVEVELDDTQVLADLKPKLVRNQQFEFHNELFTCRVRRPLRASADAGN